MEWDTVHHGTKMHVEIRHVQGEDIRDRYHRPLLKLARSAHRKVYKPPVLTALVKEKVSHELDEVWLWIEGQVGEPSKVLGAIGIDYNFRCHKGGMKKREQMRKLLKYDRLDDLLEGLKLTKKGKEFDIQHSAFIEYFAIDPAAGAGIKSMLFIEVCKRLTELKKKHVYILTQGRNPQINSFIRGMFEEKTIPAFTRLRTSQLKRQGIFNFDLHTYKLYEYKV